MKKLQKTSMSTRKKLLLGLVAIVVLGVATISTMAVMKLGPFNETKDSSTDTPTNNNSSSTSDSPSASPEKTPEQNDSGDGQAPDSQVVASITAANQNGETLQIRTLIEAVSSNGTCKLTLTKSSGQTVTRSVGIQASASSSTCQGFDIPVSELSPGPWRVVIDITVDDKTTQLTKTIDIT